METIKMHPNKIMVYWYNKVLGTFKDIRKDKQK